MLTVCHIVANYYAIRAIEMDTLNDQRSSIVITHFLEKSININIVLLISAGVILTPAEVAHQERLFIWNSNLGDITLGSPLVQLYKGNENEPSTLQRLFRKFGSENHILNITGDGKVCVAFRQEASSRDQLKALLQAHAARAAFSSGIKGWSAVLRSYSVMSEFFEQFEAEVQARGWQVQPLLISVLPWRIAKDTHKK